MNKSRIVSILTGILVASSICTSTIQAKPIVKEDSIDLVAESLLAKEEDEGGGGKWKLNLPKKDGCDYNKNNIKNENPNCDKQPKPNVVPIQPQKPNCGDGNQQPVNPGVPNTNENNGQNGNITPSGDNNETPDNKPKENKPNETPDTTQPSDSEFISQIEQLIFKRVNEERAKAGVPALNYNDLAQKYARIKSKDMAVRKYFSHEDPSGKLITEQMKADGVKYNAWGENIAYLSGYSGNEKIAEQFMINWMNSPGHRANILSTNFTSIGVGVYKSGDTYYATQEFLKQ